MISPPRLRSVLPACPSELTEETDGPSRPGKDPHGSPIVLIQSVLYGADEQSHPSARQGDLGGGRQGRMRLEDGLGGSVDEECRGFVGGRGAGARSRGRGPGGWERREERGRSHFEEEYTRRYIKDNKIVAERGVLSMNLDVDIVVNETLAGRGLGPGLMD